MPQSPEPGPDRAAELSDLVVFGVALALYGLTLAPGLLPADSGEYQLIGARLGIAHPPGYALYTLASWLATQALFWLTPARAISALSAGLAAGALTLLNRAGRTLSGSIVGGLLATLGLAASTTFWAQATTANIRMPTVFALTLALAGLTALWRRPADRKALATTGFGLGLMTSHHPSTVFLAGVFGLAAIWRVWIDTPAPARVKALAWLGLPALAPFAAWLYFPLNANGLGAPANLATLDGLIQHLTARGFGGDMLGFANARELPGRWPVLVQLIGFQWPWALVALMALGAVRGVWNVERGAWSNSLHMPHATLLIAILVHTFIAITYRAPQTTEYLLPSYVLLALLLSRLVGGEGWRGWVRGAVAALAAGLCLWRVATLTPSFQTLAADRSTDAYTRSVLAEAPPGAAVLAPWHWATPLWYLQSVEGQRPDVEVVYVLNQGEETYGVSFLRDIRRFLPERPVVLAAYDKAALDDSGLRFVPLATPGQPAWLVSEAPIGDAPTLIGERAFDAVTFLGVLALDSLRPDQRVFLAAWRVAGEPLDISFYVHALGPDGRLVAQDDQRRLATGYAAGEVLIGRFTVTAPPTLSVGPVTLTAGAYLPDGRAPRPARLDLCRGRAAVVVRQPGDRHRRPYAGDGATGRVDRR